MRVDGTWSYLYFQETEDLEARDAAYTNRGLIACSRDGVPVGVMRQISRSPEIRYRVLGLALVAGWDGGYFMLEGFSREGVSHGRGPAAEIEALTMEQENVETSAGTFNPTGIMDARERIVASIVRRRGQPEFRSRLLDAWGGRCAITGCDASEALEAVHIVPYRGPETNHLSNGLLLRADIHTLFDLGLITVDTVTMTVLIAPDLAGTSYSELAGRRLLLPQDEGFLPSKEALDRHRAWAGL